MCICACSQRRCSCPTCSSPSRTSSCRTSSSSCCRSRRRRLRRSAGRRCTRCSFLPSLACTTSHARACMHAAVTGPTLVCPAPAAAPQQQPFPLSLLPKPTLPGLQQPQIPLDVLQLPQLNIPTLPQVPVVTIQPSPVVPSYDFQLPDVKAYAQVLLSQLQPSPSPSPVREAVPEPSRACCTPCVRAACSTAVKGCGHWPGSSAWSGIVADTAAGASCMWCRPCQALRSRPRRPSR